MSNTRQNYEISNPMTSADIEKLVDEGKLLRLLRSDLIDRVKKGMSRQEDACRFVVQDEEQLYLTFDAIEDAQERQRIYTLIQQYQLGQHVNLRTLPITLRRLLEPELTGLGRFLGALILGAIAGIGIGIMAMAICILVINLIEFFTNPVALEFGGVGISATVFVIFCALGWAAASVLSWHKLKQLSLNN